MKRQILKDEQRLGNILDRSEASRLQEVVSAWKNTGYLYGLKGRDLGKMAVLAENQKRQLIKEGNTTADMAVFDTIAIPMIRRQNALMVTPNLISVQPLSYPNGVAFFQDYEVSSTKNPYAADYLTGTGNDFDQQTPEGDRLSGYDRHYNNQGYDNTKGRIFKKGYSDFTHFEDGVQASYTQAGVDLGGAGEANVAIIDFDLEAEGFQMDNVASLRVFIKNQAGVELVEGKDYFVQKTIQNWTDSILSTGRENGGKTTSGDDNSENQGPASTNSGITGPGTPNSVLRLKIIPLANANGISEVHIGYNQYLNLELNPSHSTELRMRIVSVPIQTEIHKMKTAWTMELAQDLMAYHAMDIESELTQLMAEEVAAEKDRMIIRELITLSAHTEVWNADFASAVDPNPANTVFRGHEGIYNQTLAFALNRLDGKIKKSTRKSGANWLLISAEGAAKLTNLDTFKPTDENEEGTEFAAGVERIGTIKRKWKVFVDPQLPAEVALMGRKGTSFFDTGYVYCPYIEYMLSEVVRDPQTFNPARQISSRFGTAMLNNKFYGIVWMKGIESFDVYMQGTTV